MATTGKPLQIHLRPDQDKTLRAVAAREGTSLAALIRRSIDRYLRSLPVEEDPAFRLVGLGRSGRSDMSERHDELLVKAGRD